jgi:phosphopantothenoylcysteine decarboxylase/phosphopantothenate--cysteine ligase
MARVLVSAGPTREHLDEVRFLSNASSGRMGYAIAAAARALGHDVELVSGPTELPDPRGVAVTRVTSALEMERAIKRAFARCDVLFMVAAVADHRPARARRGKTPKREVPGTLALVANPDIVAGVARRKGRRVVVGFAAEVRDALARGREKLERKHLDLIVVN